MEEKGECRFSVFCPLLARSQVITNHPPSPLPQKLYNTNQLKRCETNEKDTGTKEEIN